MHELEHRIRNALNLSCQSTSASGFYTMKCKVCDDHTIRAGFKFEDDLIIYQCFRGKCDATVVYDYNDYPSRKFRNLMKSYDVEIPHKLLIYNKKQVAPIDVNLYEKHEYKRLEMSKNFIRYNPDKDIEYRNYLSARGMNDKNYYIGGANEWRNKLIVPFHYGKILIGWQGFDIRNKNAVPLKSSGNTDMLYLPTGYVPKNPVVTEGVFDAKSIDGGIAVLQSTVSRKQAYFLKDKNPILLPDRKGSRFLNVAKKYKWSMCIPEWKEKDINKALGKYGKLVIAKMVHDGTKKNLTDAEVRYKMWVDK